MKITRKEIEIKKFQKTKKHPHTNKGKQTNEKKKREIESVLSERSQGSNSDVPNKLNVIVLVEKSKRE